MKQTNQFGLVAKEAYRLIIEERKKLESAWEIATKDLKSLSTAGKLCPREVFLGLCSDGMLQGVSKSSGRSSVNYGYARWVIRLWRKDPKLSNSEVWALAQNAGHFKVKQNGQVDVVAGLWDNLALENF